MAKKRSNQKSSPLLAARRKKRLKRADLAKQLHVDQALLKAFDEWNFQDLPETQEPVYVTLRRYARLLGVTPSELERELPSEHQSSPASMKTRRLFFISRLGYVTIVAAVVLAFLGFLGWRTLRANAVPELKVTYPESGAIVQESRIDITGMASEGAQVFVNGVTVPVETNGEFRGSVILQPGPNKVEVTAINRLARQKTVERTIIRQD